MHGALSKTRVAPAINALPVTFALRLGNFSASCRDLKL